MKRAIKKQALVIEAAVLAVFALVSGTAFCQETTPSHSTVSNDDTEDTPTGFERESVERGTRDLPAPRTVEQKSGATAFVRFGGYSFVVGEKRLSTIGLGGGFEQTVSKNLSFSLSLDQAFATQDQYSTFFTSFGFDANYAVSGFSLGSSRTTWLGPWRLAEGKTAKKAGLHLYGGLRQYVINAVTTALHYSGAGLGMRYEIPLTEKYSVRADAGLDRISSGRYAIFPARLSFGVSISL